MVDFVTFKPAQNFIQAIQVPTGENWVLASKCEQGSGTRSIEWPLSKRVSLAFRYGMCT